jgi:hypothetical protein
MCERISVALDHSAVSDRVLAAATEMIHLADRPVTVVR